MEWENQGGTPNRPQPLEVYVWHVEVEACWVIVPFIYCNCHVFRSYIFIWVSKSLHVLMNRRRFDNALIASHQLGPSTPPFPGNVSISIRSTYDVRLADRFAILLDLLGIGFEPQAVFAVEVTTVWHLMVVC